MAALNKKCKEEVQEGMMSMLSSPDLGRSRPVAFKRRYTSASTHQVMQKCQKTQSASTNLVEQMKHRCGEHPPIVTLHKSHSHCSQRSCLGCRTNNEKRD